MELYYTSMVETESLTALSEKYMKEKAHVLNNKEINLEIKDVSIYPSVIEPTLHLDCGFPLENFFIRIELNSLPKSGYDIILDLYEKPFMNLDSIIGESVTIEFQKISNTHPEARELEIPIKIGDINAHLGKCYRYYEYGIESSNDMEHIKSKVNKSIKLYNMIEKSIKNKRSLPVQNIKPMKNRSFKLFIDGSSDITLPVTVALPPLDQVQNHPTSTFIDNFGSGDIRNLHEVYIGYANNKNCIGKDMKYNLYGIYKSYPKDSIFDKFFTMFK